MCMGGVVQCHMRSSSVMSQPACIPSQWRACTAGWRHGAASHASRGFEDIPGTGNGLIRLRMPMHGQRHYGVYGVLVAAHWHAGALHVMASARKAEQRAARMHTCTNTAAGTLQWKSAQPIDPTTRPPGSPRTWPDGLHHVCQPLRHGRVRQRAVGRRCQAAAALPEQHPRVALLARADAACFGLPPRPVLQQRQRLVSRVGRRTQPRPDLPYERGGAAGGAEWSAQPPWPPATLVNAA